MNSVLHHESIYITVNFFFFMQRENDLRKILKLFEDFLHTKLSIMCDSSIDIFLTFRNYLSPLLAKIMTETSSLTVVLGIIMLLKYKAPHNWSPSLTQKLKA